MFDGMLRFVEMLEDGLFERLALVAVEGHTHGYEICVGFELMRIVRVVEEPDCIFLCCKDVSVARWHRFEPFFEGLHVAPGVFVMVGENVHLDAWCITADVAQERLRITYTAEGQ